MNTAKVRKTLLLFGYYAITCFMLISIVSAAAFFHFKLNHSLNVIQNWIFHHNYEILIYAKSVAYILIIKLLGVYSISIKDLFTAFSFQIEKIIIIVSLLATACSYFTFDFIFNSNFEFVKVFSFSLSIFLSYALDVNIINTLLSDYSGVLKLILAAISELFFFYMLSLIGIDISFFHVIVYVINLVFLLFVMNYFKRKREMFFFLFFNVLPIHLITGFDITAKSAYNSIFILKNFNFLNFVLMYILFIAYFYFKYRTAKSVTKVV